MITGGGLLGLASGGLPPGISFTGGAGGVGIGTAAMASIPSYTAPQLPVAPTAVTAAQVQISASELPGTGPTQCLCVTGMVGADVLSNDLDYNDVIDDLKHECEKHSAPGAVLQVSKSEGE